MTSRGGKQTESPTMPAAKIPIRPATLISSNSHQVPGKLTITELFFEVPLDHADPDNSEKLRIFCRSTEKFDKDGPKKEGKDGEQHLPLLVYVQGGPGFGSPPPQDFTITKEVLDRGYKVCGIYFFFVIGGFLGSWFVLGEVGERSKG